MSVTNPLVGFLSSYGPVPSSDNQYDEHVHAAIERHKVVPIVIEAVKLDDIVANFRRPDPCHVILTGTAGDGKTYHCRRAWQELGGDPAAWGRGHKEMSLRLEGSGKGLVVVKDLSELDPGEKADLIGRFCAAAESEDPGQVFLMAANDGQLLSSLRDWTERNGHGGVFSEIEALLVDEREGEGRIRLFNLSRLDPSGDFNRIADGIVGHPGWSGCEGCPLHRPGEDETCPIRINRDLLRTDKGDGLFRRRLSDLLALAQHNGLHLPIRHLFLLAVNILLGDRKPNSRMLTCVKAKNRSASDDYSATNPYENAFGENLPGKERAQYQSFTVLNSFGVGRETSNEVDDLLIYGPYRQPEAYGRLVGSDPHYGAGGEYERLRRNYVEEDREDERLFLSALVGQRRRLFFTLGGEGKLRPWDLTVYRSAGEYLEFADALGKGEGVPETEGRLFLGLNRTFCGMMIEDSRKVYVTYSGGDGRGRISPILVHEIQRKARGLRAKFDAENGGPHVVFLDETGQEVERTRLHLTHFEYLVRIAGGSLPANFSRQCHEDFLDMKTRLSERLGGPDDGNEFTILSVQPNGHPLLHEVQL